MNETHDILQRMRELTVQAGNTGTQESDDLDAIQAEIDSLVEELGGEEGSKGISDRTQFNGKDLLTGDFATSESDLVFQIGANGEQQLSVNIADMSAEALEVNEIDVTAFAETAANEEEGFDETLEAIDSAIKNVSSTRSELGAVQNRLEHTINNLGASSENLTAAESRIRDVDHTEAA